MNKFFTFFLLLFGSAQVFGQTIADFEHFDLPVDTFLHNSGEAGGFVSGNIFLPNDYNAEFNAWTGWAISTTRDSLTPGPPNQYSAITAGGVDSSQTYAVSFAFGSNILRLIGEGAGGGVAGVYVTNNAYAYYSMLDGDSFSKKFGGETGEDPDFFLLTVKKYLNDTLSTDSVNLYLADYRFEDPNEDYILKEWTWLDLSPLGDADSLAFLLSSSDVGQHGMNTPAYFCIDKLTTADQTTSNAKPLTKARIRMYPNPATDQLFIQWPEAQGAVLGIRDLQGRLLRKLHIHAGINQLPLASLPKGLYLLQILGRPDWQVQRLVKH